MPPGKTTAVAFFRQCGVGAIQLLFGVVRDDQIVAELARIATALVVFKSAGWNTCRSCKNLREPRFALRNRLFYDAQPTS
jgi:hypothetical protein